MKALRRIFATPDGNPGEALVHDQVVIEETASELSVQSDRPITSVAEDIFDRAPFARQIAETIALRRDRSSLVIALYGPWGDGKTSTLAMVKEYLRVRSDILTMDYNPWFFGDSTEAITRSFFNSIKTKLEKSGWFSRENIADLMSTFGKAIPQVGDAVHDFGEAMTTEALTETRDRVSGILRKHGKKIVVFIDDIDRLDRREIQTLFKLVRLSGDFDHTTYVLAFDDAIVAESLGEVFGQGDPLAGQRFLEKIVQVPLHLPPARPDKLLNLMFKACDRVVADGGMDLDEAEGAELGHALAETFGQILKTPRRVKLFDNAITFAVPILKGEVRVVDQIQIEALRVFYPTVYDAVRSNPDRVLRGQDYHAVAAQNAPSPVDMAISALAIGDVEKKVVRHRLEELFPRLGNAHYGNDWDRRWAVEKRICSTDYFARYFTYGVPTGDMPDQTIEALLAKAVEGDNDAVGAALDDAFARDASELLIRKLRSREETLHLAPAPTLILEIAKRASKIPVTRDIVFGTFTLSQAAILVRQIAIRLEEAQQNSLLKLAAENTDCLPFVSQLMRWSRLEGAEGQDQGFLTPERIHPLAKILAERFFAAADSSNIVDGVGGYFGEFAYAIMRDGDDATKRELRNRLTAFLDAHPQNALSLLKGLGGRSQGGDGVVRVSEFSSETHASVSKLLDVDRVYAQLRALYGSELDTATWEAHWDNDFDADRRLADQFSAIHRRITSQPESAD